MLARGWPSQTTAWKKTFDGHCAIARHRALLERPARGQAEKFEVELYQEILLWLWAQRDRLTPGRVRGIMSRHAGSEKAVRGSIPRSGTADQRGGNPCLAV